MAVSIGQPHSLCVSQFSRVGIDRLPHSRQENVRWLKTDGSPLTRLPFTSVSSETPRVQVDRPQADACPQGAAHLEIFEQTRLINGFDASVAAP